MNHRYDYRTGWLTPEGEFYGCSFMDHTNLADWLFDMSEQEMEDHGNCKIYRHYLATKEEFDDFPGGHNLTEAQCKYLLDNNYITPEEYDELRGHI